jgi:hypothetical protein
MMRLILTLALPLAAADPAGRPLLNGKDLTGWHPQDGKPSEWFTTTTVTWTPEPVPPHVLSARPEPGSTIVNGPKGKTANLVTDEKFGDVELRLEFMVPRQSNSGVYLHGLYEIQVLDSYGIAKPGVHDCGAVYERWIDNKGVGGSPPKRNASLEPGKWQSFEIWFEAPRFDASGKKVRNARFVRVTHNGVLVQENVEVDGPTRAHMKLAEAETNPVMLQGDHGPVAYRNITVRPLARGR